MFYISCRGSSATTWLAKVLSSHPKIVCFRSTRSFPPVTPDRSFPSVASGIPQMSADRFLEGLLECERATLDEKVFGSTHGYHGIVAKEPCEKKGGIFSYITRHPVSRVHSAFIQYLYLHYYQRYNIEMTNSDIHDHVCSALLRNSDLMKYTELYQPHEPGIIKQGLIRPAKKMAKNILPDSVVNTLIKRKMIFSELKRFLPQSKLSIAPDERVHASNLFVKLIYSFFNWESELYPVCPLNYGIKMEEMVKSKEYFKSHVLQRVAPQLPINDSSFRVSKKRVNVHRDMPLSPEEIWKTWPNGMKRVFLYYFEKYNVSTICKDFDYDISFI
jgi:hypothetical protein